MALSFEESKKLAMAAAAKPMMMSMRSSNIEIINEDWQKPDNSHMYDYYDHYDNKYSDNNISTVDDEKNVVLSNKQINITQESNSQYIPFKIPRYYDGFDLSKTIFAIYWVNKAGYGSFTTPVDVYFNETEIKFAWLVDENVTSISGQVQFEIQASGENQLGYKYLWKTKPNSGINVLQGLEVKEFIEPDDTWQESFIDKIVSERKRAETASNNAFQHASLAQTVYSQIEDVRDETIGIRDSLLDGISDEVKTVVDNIISAYALKEYVDDSISEVTDKIPTALSELNNDADFATKQDVIDAIDAEDITGKLTNYALKTDIPTKVGELTNDVGYLTEHQSLEGYATKDYVGDQINKIDISDKLGELGTDDEGNPITTVVDYVNKMVDSVDVSDQFGDLGKNEDGSEKTVKQYVDESVSNVNVDLSGYATKDDLSGVEKNLGLVSQNTITNAENISTIQGSISQIQSSLDALEGDNKDLIIQYNETGSMLSLYEKDENGDITITDGDEEIKVKEISSTVIKGAGGGGSTSVSRIKLGLYVDGEASNTVLYGNDISLNYNLSTKELKEEQDENGKDIYEEAIIAGDITLTLYKNNVYLTHFTVTKNSSSIQGGFVDVSKYVTVGDQIFTLKASYVEKLDSDETITVRSGSANWTVKAVNLKLSDLPSPTWEATPKYGITAFSYTPIGAIEKTIYFKIDDNDPETVITSLNGTALTYNIPKQTHGVHTLSVWCEGNIGGTVISTDPVKYVLMFVEEGNNNPIIRIKAPETLEQYSSSYIYYNIFDPLNAVIKSVTIYDEDGAILSSVENITSAEQKLEFRPSEYKTKTITFKYNEITESVTIEVTKFPYEISAVTGSLMVDFVPTGRTNYDADYNVFKNSAYTIEIDENTGIEEKKEIPVSWTLSDNFDWINGGWKIDENGDTYFCVKSGTSVDINYNLFGSDGVISKKDVNGDYTIAGTGKEFKLIFKTSNVAQADAVWLQCIDVADKKSLGIRMESQNAYIDSGLGTLEIPYVDNDIIEFDMNIVPITKFLDDGQPDFKAKTIPMVITYEDGTPVQPKVISSARTSFKQDAPKPITIGSAYCDVHIYRMKIYERYLEDKEIITNFIADARSGAEMARRYVKNDIYPIEDKQKITPESVAAACPDLKVYILSAPHFTNDKKDKVSGTTIKQIHNTGTKEKPEYDLNENWTATGATHNGQGTSSNEYGYSGRNLEFDLKKATITLNDNVTVVKEIQLSPTSYPTNYLNFKINIASSESANNSLLQKRYDRYLPYTSVASLIDDRKKNSMEFFNCVVFIQETDEDIATHREFSDTDVHFYGIGNIGDSKKTDSTRVNDPNDEKEFCVEIMDWNRDLSSFPMETRLLAEHTINYAQAKEEDITIDNLNSLYEETEVDGDTVYVRTSDVEIIEGKIYYVETETIKYIDFLVPENCGENGIVYEMGRDGKLVHSMDTIIDLSKDYYVDILEGDDFSEDYTYGFRYIRDEWKKDDYADYKERNEAFQKPLREKWIEFYRFVTRDLTTNGNEDSSKVEAWKSEFSNWFITESAFYYYLYTLRYTMVDNRAKNTFWHWGKHYLTLQEALDKGIAVYDSEKNLITDASNSSPRFYDANGNEIANINATAAAINDGYRMEFWAYDNDTALGIDNAGKLEIPIGVEEIDTDPAGVPYFRAHDSLVFERIAKYFVKELENTWHNTEINQVGKVFDSITFMDEFDSWQNQFPEELWRLDYERKYKRTYVGGTGKEWDNALPQSNKSDIVSTRFLTEMMNGRKKYQRRCFERNQEVYMASKFKGEVNIGDTITLRGTGKPSNKVVAPNFTLNVTPFSKMYVNLYNATDSIYYHERLDAGKPVAVPYPNSTLDFIYIRGASQIQSIGDLSPMYLQTAELTPGSKLKTIKLGNATNGYSNDSLKTLQIGAGNKLLEELDIRNLSNLNDTNLPVSNIPSLKRLYAQGSNVSEVVFANNGLLEEAYLPSTITRLELRNLNYLKTIDLESYDNLLHLVVMDCSDIMNDLALDMINNAPDLKTLRVTNIEWRLNSTALLKRLYSLIVNHSAPEVMLTGVVHVPQIGQHDLSTYQNIWPDLTISVPEGGIIPQYKVTFVNHDGTELDVQYIDRYEDATDPTNQDYENYIGIPTKESTPQYSYEFSGWHPSFTNVDKNTIVTAQYKENVREYTVQYRMGIPSIPLSESIIKTYTNIPYGNNAVYDGEIPTYTAAEPTIYYMFKGWDKSGIADGDFDENGVKVINAVWDSFQEAKGFNNPDGTQKKLEDLSPVEVYALIDLNKRGKVNIGSNNGQESENYAGFIADKDKYSFTLGCDFDYDDVPSVEIIGKNSEFGDEYKTPIEFIRNSDGTGTYFDTGIQLFDEDKDFVLAIDYEFTGAVDNSVLAQCCRVRTNGGFKLLYNNGAQLKWTSNTTSKKISSVNKREMVVIRHKKGDPNLTVYSSDLDYQNIFIEELSGTDFTVTDSDTLVFGCEKQSATSFNNYASGKINWAKIWYKDIGDDACKDLASWVHEDIDLQACGFNRYFIADTTDDEQCSFSLIATHLLKRVKRWNPTKSGNTVGTGNIGGWAESELNKYLNTRLYNALPIQIKSLIKQVEVYSSTGNSSFGDPSSSNCYITIPAAIELDASKNYSPLDTEGTPISFITKNELRKRAFRDAEKPFAYWTRSPYAYADPSHTSAGSYVHYVKDNGEITQIGGVDNEYGVLIMISF